VGLAVNWTFGAAPVPGWEVPGMISPDPHFDHANPNSSRSWGCRFWALLPFAVRIFRCSLMSMAALVDAAARRRCSAFRQPSRPVVAHPLHRELSGSMCIPAPLSLRPGWLHTVQDFHRPGLIALQRLHWTAKTEAGRPGCLQSSTSQAHVRW